MKAFQINTDYVMGWIGDSELKTVFTVVKRTPSFVTVQDVKTGETYRAKIKVRNNEEYVLPLGSYSMAPCLKAGKVAQ